MATENRQSREESSVQTSADQASPFPALALTPQFPADLLRILPYPPRAHVSALLPDEIAQAVRIYLYTVSSFLRLDSDSFTASSDITNAPGNQIIDFLKRYVSQRDLSLPPISSAELDDKIFTLLFRIISEGREISLWVDWSFVLDVVSSWYDPRQVDVAALLTRLWRRAREKMTSEFTHLRNEYISSLDLMVLDEANDIVHTLTALRYATTLSPEILGILSDDDNKFLGVLHGHYNVYRTHFSEDERNAILYLCYTLLVCLAYQASHGPVGQSKKGKGTSGVAERGFVGAVERVLGEFGRSGRMDSFVEDLDSETPFSEVMGEWLREWKGADEPVEGLTAVLERLKVANGQVENEISVSEDESKSELQKTSLISEVVDILPHLGEGFIEACLSAYSWNLEQTVAAILSNDLPPHLATMNQSTPRLRRPKNPSPPMYGPPEYTPSDRRNIFDNDAFDLKQVSPTQIHRGRKQRASATELLNNNRKFMQSQKAKILATQWDEYEDEYVDTYDSAELTSSKSTNARLRTIRDDVDEETTEEEAETAIERVVLAAYKRAPGAFERAARKSKERDTLKKETGWSDEQIEGWKSMAERDPSVLKRLEEKEMGDFVQSSLPSTAWRASVSTESEEEGGTAAGVGRGGRGRGTARGRAK